MLKKFISGVVKIALVLFSGVKNMKKILVIDESALIRDYLKQKLEEYGFEVVAAINGLDGTAKTRQEIPDLIIMDYYLSRTSSIDLLKNKTKDPNTSSIPVVMVSTKIDRDTILNVAKYNVKKFFTKPIKLDALIKTISELLGVSLEIDTAPCIIEAHFNEDILFIEIARGLNREKIELLKYKITELLDLYAIKSPKVLVMMTSIDITPNDSIKLGALMNNILEYSNAKHKYVKVLTNNKYVSRFITEKKEYEGILVTSSLEKAMDGLLGRSTGTFLDGEGKAVHEEFLSASAPKKERQESIHMRFDEEKIAGEPVDLKDIQTPVTIAVVDDDEVIQELIKTAFSETEFTIKTFENGLEFMEDQEALQADLLFLDILMPEMDGFEVLKRLKVSKNDIPVIMLSAVSQKETVVKAIKLGVTSYLTKPLKPEDVLRKATEILRMNF
jgi:DNA-binding response OmpR family regulator